MINHDCNSSWWPDHHHHSWICQNSALCLTQREKTCRYVFRTVQPVSAKKLLSLSKSTYIRIPRIFSLIIFYLYFVAKVRPKRPKKYFCLFNFNMLKMIAAKLTVNVTVWTVRRWQHIWTKINRISGVGDGAARQLCKRGDECMWRRTRRWLVCKEEGGRRKDHTIDYEECNLFCQNLNLSLPLLKIEQ